MAQVGKLTGHAELPMLNLSSVAFNSVAQLPADMLKSRNRSNLSAPANGTGSFDNVQWRLSCRTIDV